MVAYASVQYNTRMVFKSLRRRGALSAMSAAAVVLSFVSCAGAPAAAEKSQADLHSTAEAAFSGTGRTVDAGVRFTAAAATRLEVPTVVGAVSPNLMRRMDVATATVLTADFRAAYIEALFRGIALMGALGGDRVNGWPFDVSDAYTQNWRGATGVPNSWGLPTLVLAVRPAADDRAFVVTGAVLDAYGRGEGLGGANGVAGYGAPLSDEFPFEGGVAQRFQRGLIAIGADGTRRFLPQEAPSAGIDPGSGVGAYREAPPAGHTVESIAAAFRSAWLAAVDRGLPAAAADGPVRRVSFSVSAAPPKAAPAPTEGTNDFDAGFGADKKIVSEVQVRLESALVQTYGKAAWALVLPAGEGAGSRTVLLAPPFLDFLIAKGSWEAAFGDYGAPLSDPFPRGGKTVQRFSAGWIEGN